MHHFLRILAGAGAGVADLQPATSNEDLVNALRRVGVVKTYGGEHSLWGQIKMWIPCATLYTQQHHDPPPHYNRQSVYDALRVCARDLFVPARHRQEAFIDTPIRLDEYDFNISAPHMHATCLEALDIQPGNRYRETGHLLYCSVVCVVWLCAQCCVHGMGMCLVCMECTHNTILSQPHAGSTLLLPTKQGVGCWEWLWCTHCCNGHAGVWFCKGCMWGGRPLFLYSSCCLPCDLTIASSAVSPQHTPVSPQHLCHLNTRSCHLNTHTPPHIQAGPSGVAVGIDIKQAAVTMGSSNVEHLCMTNQQYVGAVCGCCMWDVDDGVGGWGGVHGVVSSLCMMGCS